jgi:hypothetical protein
MFQFMASNASTALASEFETDPGSGTWRIDDVSARLVNGVPMSEASAPATVIMFASALVGLMALRRRKLAI